MNRKIEQLLQVAADFHGFCESRTSFTAHPRTSDELSEHDLDLIAAAANTPMHVKPPASNKE